MRNKRVSRHDEICITSFPVWLLLMPPKPTFNRLQPCELLSFTITFPFSKSKPKFAPYMAPLAGICFTQVPISQNTPQPPLDLTSDLVDGFGKTLHVAAGDTSNGDTAIFGSVDRVLQEFTK